MPRLFLAIDLPEEVKAALARLSPELPTAQWVSTKQLHLTLRFIGDTEPRTMSSIKTALAGLSFKPFSLTLRGVGHFPPVKRPRVIWVGMEPSDTLAQLRQDLERALICTGLAPDERRLSPHITLARLKETLPVSVSAFEIRHRDLYCAPFEVSEIILFSSVLTNQGAIHNQEATLHCQDASLFCSVTAP